MLRAEWLHPGLLVTAMGADQADKHKIAPVALAAADLYVCDQLSQAAKMAELRAARAAGFLQSDPPKLGRIVLGAHPGRASADRVTIRDLTRPGARDTAIAAHALAAARSAGAGLSLPRGGAS